MCLAVYLASDQPLPLIAWNEQAPGFHVDALAKDDQAVIRQFQMAYVCYMGAHTFCGCGFQSEPYRQYDNQSISRTQEEESRLQLAQYLEQRLRGGAQLQIFACWEGDQERTPEERRTLSPIEISAPDFYFHELELIEVVERNGVP